MGPVGFSRQGVCGTGQMGPAAIYIQYRGCTRIVLPACPECNEGLTLSKGAGVQKSLDKVPDSLYQCPQPTETASFLLHRLS